MMRDFDIPHKRRKVVTHVNIPAWQRIASPPTAMTVTTGTLDTGTVDDLAALDGTDVNISEQTGTDAIVVRFDFEDVTEASMFAFYGRYAGSTSHIIAVEVLDVGAGSPEQWDIIGLFSSTDAKQWYTFMLHEQSRYNNAGAVSVRLRHISSGNITHDLILDYVAIVYSAQGATISTGGGATSGLELGETATTAYRGDRGKAAYDHSLAAHAPSDAVSLATVKADTDIASAISLKHSHTNKATLDAVQEALTTALKASYDAAVTASHSHANKATLDLITEAFTSALKAAYDAAVTASHSHSNKATLDAIQEALTTVLKANYDAAYTHSTTAHAPSTAEQNVNADWNAVSGDAQILNKPTLPVVSDVAYDATWNGNTDAPSKNAIYDKLETMGGSGLTQQQVEGLI